MSIRPDPGYAAASPALGEFLGMFESEHGQAQASLFRRNGVLRAYLSVAKGLEPEQITDRYLTELEQFARDQGLSLKILHVVN